MKYLIVLVAALSLVGCSKESEPQAESSVLETAIESQMTKIENIKGADTVSYLEEHPDTVILDIRTPEEFASGHMANARNIDFRSSDFQELIDILDQDQTYLVHCQSGGRSGKSLEFFKRSGFKTIVHMDDGFGGWQSAGNPVEH